MMKPEMIVDEYRKAKNKGETIKILAQMNHTSIEEIVDILKENGARPGKFLKKTDGSQGETGEAKKDGSSSIQEAGSQEEIETGDRNEAAETDKKEEAETNKQGETETENQKNTERSSSVPEAVRIALKERAEFLSLAIKQHKNQMEECYKAMREILEYTDSIGMSEKDLMR